MPRPVSTPQNPRIIGILGGTFDPVHLGHLHCAEQLALHLQLDAVHLMPCYQPIHKPKTQTTPAQRWAMLALACQSRPDLPLILDDTEFSQKKPVSTLDSLKCLQKQHSNTHLCWIIGADAFTGLPNWRGWPQHLDIAHILVVSRPPATSAHRLTAWETARQNLRSQPHGHCLHLSVPPHPAAASHIRKLCQNIDTAGSTAFTDHLPPNVAAYIKKQKIYRG